MAGTDEGHFKTIPWCSKLLINPNIIITTTRSRQPKTRTEDTLIFKTLKSAETIKFCPTFYTRPTFDSSWIEDIRVLVSVGMEMNGGPYMLHGGIAATLMDEALSNLMTLNNETHQAEEHPSGTSAVTASLNVRYLRPIKTPGTYLIVAKCVEKTFNKFLMAAEIQNAEGALLAKADSVWVRVPRIYGGKL